MIVVPTYNELENIDPLVGKIEEILGGCALEVLFVDDGSPDGTAARLRERAVTRPWIHVLEREERMGLGSAYRAGFAWGRAHGFERIGEMDADLSHDPAYLPALDAAVRDGADLALGSRYTAGGSSEGWPLHRRMLSKGANRFARTLLRLRTRDVTGGFRIYDARAIDLLLRQGTECDGYGFQVEGVVAVTRAGMRITEVPIVFRDRTYGVSKMSNKIVWEATRRCLSLAFAKPATPAGDAVAAEQVIAMQEGATDGR
ncbi:MAG: polyprenol monophosphomannose synthase [Actinomycetota bacterium]